MARRVEAQQTPKTPHEASTQPRPVDVDFYSTDAGVGAATIDASPKFVFAHHPKRWTIVDGRIVPELIRVPLQSGLNRVMVGTDGRVRMHDTRALLEQKSRVIIGPELGPGGKSYLQAVDTLSNGKIVPAVITVWETAHAGESKTEWDYGAYADWLESLVASGKIAPITQHRAGEIAAATRQLLDKAITRLGTERATGSARVQELRTQLAIWEAAAKKTRGGKVQTKAVELEVQDG